MTFHSMPISISLGLSKDSVMVVSSTDGPGQGHSGASRKGPLAHTAQHSRAVLHAQQPQTRQRRPCVCSLARHYSYVLHRSHSLYLRVCACQQQLQSILLPKIPLLLLAGAYMVECNACTNVWCDANVSNFTFTRFKLSCH